MKEDTKICKDCKMEFPLSSFYKNNGGRLTRCKHCVKKRYGDYMKNYSKTYVPKIDKETKEKYAKQRREATMLWRQRLRETNPKRLKELYRKYNDKYFGTPQGLIRKRMTHIIGYTLRRIKRPNIRGRKWEKIVGYTAAELKNHLQAKFTEGMTWDKFLKGKIQIDHIKPDILFKYSSTEEDDFKKSWSLSNLQPLWSADNWKKRANYNDSLTK